MFGQQQFSPFTSPFSQPLIKEQPASIGFPQPKPQNLEITDPTDPKNLTRVINYLADYSGCGLWRMIWPEHVLNAHHKALCQSSSVMILQPEFYNGVKAIRLQRQATPHQLKFVEFLKHEVQPRFGTRLIYEIDDIIFREDIPDYNKFKFAFESDEIRETSVNIMRLCDEVTVTCKYMRDYYREKSGKKEVTIIPNFPPRFWMGNFFNEKRVGELYKKHYKRPRILYAGSGAHFDVENKVNQNDDFNHVIDSIIRTRKKYQWVFVGAYPLRLHPHVVSGDIEFHPWQQIYSYPKKLHDLELQMAVAPLFDNVFNRSKSDLKYIEACCLGIPIACQDMCTYENAPIKFKTGDEMIRRIEETLKDGNKYRANARRRYQVAEGRFLENEENIGCYVELYNLPYGDPDRKLLSKWN